MQRVGDAQFVGGEGGGRPGGARVAEAGEGVRGGGTARWVAVVEEEHQGFEGPPVARESQPERGQFPGPQRLSWFGEDGCQGVGVPRRHEAVVRRRSARLGP